MNRLFSLVNDVKKNNKIKKHIREYFNQEDLYMRGKEETSSKDQSILYFTVHRCASRYVAKIIKQLMTNSDLTYIDLVGYLWHGGQVHRKDMEVYKKYGYVYGPFYGLDKEEMDIPVSNYDDFKILLMLRDPRDVLTSYYFHHAYDPYCNPAQQEYINNRSKKALEKTVDEWVLEETPMFKDRYKAYLDKFHRRPNVLFIKYEDMISDFDNCLRRLENFMNLSPGEKILESIRKQANFSVNKEDVKSHKRQVTPGDYMRKLKVDTINVLNAEFGEILVKLGYK